MMSLAWMLLLTLVVFAEKVFPHGQRVSAVIGVVLILLGLVVEINPTTRVLHRFLASADGSNQRRNHGNGGMDIAEQLALQFGANAVGELSTASFARLPATLIGAPQSLRSSRTSQRRRLAAGSQERSPAFCVSSSRS